MLISLKLGILILIYFLLNLLELNNKSLGFNLKLLFNFKLVRISTDYEFYNVMIQSLPGADANGVVGALGGFFWPLTCLVLIMANQKLKESQAE